MNKDINKQRNRSKTIPRPPMYRGRGNNKDCILEHGDRKQMSD